MSGGGSRTVAGSNSQSRPSIIGRGSQHGGGDGDWRLPGVIARTSTAQASELKKAEHAWKPIGAKLKDLGDDEKDKMVSASGFD
jgi:hypothetical protein